MKNITLIKELKTLKILKIKALKHSFINKSIIISILIVILLLLLTYALIIIILDNKLYVCFVSVPFMLFGTAFIIKYMISLIKEKYDYYINKYSDNNIKQIVNTYKDFLNGRN